MMYDDLIATLGTDDLEYFSIVDGDVVSQVIAERDMMSAIEPEFKAV
jgi:hypothetical protein